MIGCVALLACALVVSTTSLAGAQDRGVYVGGAFVLHTQPHSTTDQQGNTPEPLGGTTWGVSALLGKHLSTRFSVEIEPSFSGPYRNEYTYPAGPSFSAHEVDRRRDTFLTFQLRTRISQLEPVIGVSYVLERMSRHATAFGRTYFDDGRTDHGAAVVAGVDAPVKLAGRFSIVPTFRMFVVSRRSDNGSIYDPIGSATSTGSLVLRYGVCGRFDF